MSLARTRCSISVPPVPKRSSTKGFKILATDLPVIGLPSKGSNNLSNAASACDRTHDSSEMSFVPYSCVEHFLFQIAYTFRLSTTHNNIGELVWESYHNCKELCPTGSTSVQGHHSCRMQVTSISQQYKEDDQLLVVIDTQHHDSHKKTVFERKLSQDPCENFPILAAAIWQLIRNPRYSFCLSWKPLNTNLACALRKFPCLSVLMVSTQLPVT